MEQIKEAFSKVKQDIDSLKKEFSDLNKELIETRESLVEICNILRNFSKRLEDEKQFNEININKQSKDLEEIRKMITERKDTTHLIEKPTEAREIPTNQHIKTPQNPQKAQNYGFSTGNEGVPTDRQTDQQTDQQTQESSYNNRESLNLNSINNAAQILESLDNLKKEIRLKFKRLTDQEFLVFSAIYQLSEEKGYTDYKNLSERLHLTESSIRDYIGRLIKKGIPLDKIKINNKTIHISISPNLKKVASLPTILQLRAI
ncbi:MAG: helix-turn-helix domain-containing protein [Nanobdellota archaeon]